MYRGVSGIAGLRGGGGGGAGGGGGGGVGGGGVLQGRVCAGRLSTRRITWCCTHWGKGIFVVSGADKHKHRPVAPSLFDAAIDVAAARSSCTSLLPRTRVHGRVEGTQSVEYVPRGRVQFVSASGQAEAEVRQQPSTGTPFAGCTAAPLAPSFEPRSCMAKDHHVLYVVFSL